MNNKAREGCGHAALCEYISSLRSRGVSTQLRHALACDTCHPIFQTAVNELPISSETCMCSDEHCELELLSDRAQRCG